MDPVDRRARARSRAEGKFGFYKHLAAYVAVNLMESVYLTPHRSWSKRDAACGVG